MSTSRSQLQKSYESWPLMWPMSTVFLKSSLNNSNVQPGLRTPVGQKVSGPRSVPANLPFKVLWSLRQGNVIRSGKSLINDPLERSEDKRARCAFQSKH